MNNILEQKQGWAGFGWLHCNAAGAVTNLNSKKRSRQQPMGRDRKLGGHALALVSIPAVHSPIRIASDEI